MLCGVAEERAKGKSNKPRERDSCQKCQVRSLIYTARDILAKVLAFSAPGTEGSLEVILDVKTSMLTFRSDPAMTGNRFVSSPQQE